MKTNKKLVLLTSMVILFPMLWGADDLVAIANQIPIHFNFAGQANNFQSETPGCVLVFLFSISWCICL